MKTRILTLLLTLCALPFANAQQAISLKQAIETSLANNISIKQGANAIESARVGLEQIKMNRLPNFNAGAGQSVNFGRSVNHMIIR